MKSRNWTRRRYFRRGSMLVQSAIFGGAVGVGIAALAIDTGLMYGAKHELQAAADAAALAAASQLGEADDPQTLAAQEAARFAGLNEVAGSGVGLSDTEGTDIELVFGHAALNGEKFEFHPNVTPYDAVEVTLRRDATVSDGPVSLVFAKMMGSSGANFSASATAMLAPRDISLVIDLSASMNDDSELRHYDDFDSESGGPGEGVQINLEDIWLMFPQVKGNAGVGNGLDPPPPGQPYSENDQAGTGPGAPANAGGNPSPGAEGHVTHEDGGGPRWGWMTGWGDEIVLGSYSPVGDVGLYYIPRYVTCTDAEVIENITTSGYTANERSALLSGQYDGDSSLYLNRVKALVGLAGWKSKKKIGTVRDSKFVGGAGNADDVVDSNELWQHVDYPFDSGSWDDYINYVAGSSQMRTTDANFQYRYGLKTAANYVLEKKPTHDQTPELANTPEEPLQSVKDAVQTMIDTVIALDTQDHVSLELFAQYGRHGWDLTVPDSPELLAAALQNIPDALGGYQAGHYTVYTNIGAGLQEAIHELSNGEYGAYNDGDPVPHDRARHLAAKVVIMLTDGKPNTDENNNYVGNNDPAAVLWAEDSADVAKSLGMTIYTIGVGGDVNEDLCVDIASMPENYFFADNTPDPENGGRPMYVTQLLEIFETLGTCRPVRLIQ